MFRKLCALGVFMVLLAACGGGGGGGGSTSSGGGSGSGGGGSTGTPIPGLTNLTTLTVDAGPAGLSSGANGYIQANFAYVSVTLCAPGTSNCQTIDHVQVDTGSTGLRILASALNASLLSALPAQTDPSSNPVGECYGYIDGYVFGSVRQADFKVGGENVSGMPLQVIGDGGAFTNTPSSCSSGGGSDLNTVQALGANGVIGLGTTATDCGVSCTAQGGYGAAIYYDCPSSGCSTIITRTSSTTAPFQQLPNPVAAMAVDNNGVIVSLPAPASSGAASLSGTLYFGIGTETNNALGSASVVPATDSASTSGAGLITAVYKGQTLPDSFIDSGSSIYFFVDSTIAQCTGTYAGYYCPASPVTLSPTVVGQNGASVSAAFTLENAQSLLSSTYPVLPGLGGDPQALGLSNAYPTSFDFGLPFFYGRNVFTAIEGRNAGGVAGPYYAY